MITRALNRRLLSISGPDANDFLQGLISADLRRLQCHSDVLRNDLIKDSKETEYALKKVNLLPTLFLSSNGHILAESLIFRKKDEFVLDVGIHTFEKLMQVINRRKLAADITMRQVEDTKVYVRIPDYMSHFPAVPTPPSAVSHETVELQDPRGEAFGNRIYKTEACDQSISGSIGTLESLGIYEKLMLINGCTVELLDNLADLKLLPQDLKLEKLGYVSRNKGCFIGQEIMNRIFNKTLLNKYNLMLVMDKDYLQGNQTAVQENNSGILAKTPLGISLGKVLDCSKDAVESTMLNLLHKPSRVHDIKCETKSVVPLLYFSSGFGFVVNRRMNTINSVTINGKAHVCQSI